MIPARLRNICWTIIPAVPFEAPEPLVFDAGCPRVIVGQRTEFGIQFGVQPVSLYAVCTLPGGNQIKTSNIIEATESPTTIWRGEDGTLVYVNPAPSFVDGVLAFSIGTNRAISIESFHGYMPGDSYFTAK